MYTNLDSTWIQIQTKPSICMLKNICSFQPLFSPLLPILPTFYAQPFYTKVLRSAFLYLHFRLALFWCKNIGKKVALKMLVNWHLVVERKNIEALNNRVRLILKTENFPRGRRSKDCFCFHFLPKVISWHLKHFFLYWGYNFSTRLNTG